MLLRLISGFPPVLDYYHDDRPGPVGFVKVLLQELNGVDLQESVEEGRQDDGIMWEARGRFKPPYSGLSWQARGLVDDSSSYSEELRGDLPTLQLHWSADYHKSGYAHRPHDQYLEVEFADPRTERCFRRVWRQVYGRSARFAAVAAPESEKS